MPISLPPSAPTGVANRFLGSVGLDDNVNAFCESLIPTSTRAVQLERIENRFGRMTRVKEDAVPVVINLKGSGAVCFQANFWNSQ